MNRTCLTILCVLLIVTTSGQKTVSAQSKRASWLLSEIQSADDRVRAQLFVTPSQPRLSDAILLTLIVETDAMLDVRMPEFGTSLGDLTIKNVRQQIQGVGEEIERHSLILEIVPKQGGTTPVWPMAIRYSDRRDGFRDKEFFLELPACELTILADVTPETASLEKIPAMQTLLSKPESMSRWIAPVILGIAAVLLILAKILRKREVERSDIPTLSTQEIAMKRLEQLLESRLHQTDVKQFYVELTGIVRWYIERQTRIRAPELTTEEFLHEISKHWKKHPTVTGDIRDRLRLFLESSDMVKFARFNPSEEDIMQGFRRAEGFVKAFAAQSSFDGTVTADRE